MPTVNCLVELTEMPFCVVSICDIEVVNLERVGFNLKNFDMAIVFKDFTRDVSGGLGTTFTESELSNIFPINRWPLLFLTAFCIPILPFLP